MTFDRANKKIFNLLVLLKDEPTTKNYKKVGRKAHRMFRLKCDNPFFGVRPSICELCRKGVICEMATVHGIRGCKFFEEIGK